MLFATIPLFAFLFLHISSFQIHISHKNSRLRKSLSDNSLQNRISFSYNTNIFHLWGKKIQDVLYGLQLKAGSTNGFIGRFMCVYICFFFSSGGQQNFKFFYPFSKSKSFFSISDGSPSFFEIFFRPMSVFLSTQSFLKYLFIVLPCYLREVKNHWYLRKQVVQLFYKGFYWLA